MKRLLHLGVGNFFRAHQAWYTFKAAGGWRITGVSLCRPDMRDALRPQNWRYALEVSDAHGREVQVIDVLDTVLVAAEDSAAVVAAIADPQVHVITLTVTEKGYALAPDGLLQLDAPAIVADLSGGPAVSTIGLLAAGLLARSRHGAPVTVLSCDNLSENGIKLEAAVKRFCHAAGVEIDKYLEKSVTFPSCMVDRITPSTDAGLVARVHALGPPARAAVATERFTEWVIEDRFAGPRPMWERAGAVFTQDVSGFEQRKLGMLNGAHSCLAYAGLLAGHTFVHQAVADPDVKALASGVMDEAAAVLPVPLQAGAQVYQAELFARFANPFLHHKLRQIAMDGTLKVPIRILATQINRKRQGLESPACDAVVAAYGQFITAECAAGRQIEDPNAKALKQWLTQECDMRTFLQRLA
ncbi:MAG: fructuronate reductase [Paracoccaceae bacterium]|jgi:fructuronate reductase